MLAPSILSADFTNIREDFKIMNEENVISFMWTLWMETTYQIYPLVLELLDN